MPPVRTGLGALRQRGAASRAPRPIANPSPVVGAASDSPPRKESRGREGPDYVDREEADRAARRRARAPRCRSRPGYSSLQRLHQGKRNRGTAVEQRKRQRARDRRTLGKERQVAEAP